MQLTVRRTFIHADDPEVMALRSLNRSMSDSAIDYASGRRHAEVGKPDAVEGADAAESSESTAASVQDLGSESVEDGSQRSSLCSHGGHEVVAVCGGADAMAMQEGAGAGYPGAALFWVFPDAGSAPCLAWPAAALAEAPEAVQRWGWTAAVAASAGAEVCAPGVGPSAAWAAGAAAERLQRTAAHLQAVAKGFKAEAQALRGSQDAAWAVAEMCTETECVPEHGSVCTGSQEAANTTIMLRNLPNNYSRDMLLELLDREGFGRSYDFVYYPVDFKRWAGLGYAFVNLVSHAEALRLWSSLDGFSRWELPSSKVVQVCWGSPLQGLEDCTQRYRNSPVMHESVPEHFKPLVFGDGKQIPFPPPTKKIRNPRWRRV